MNKYLIDGFKKEMEKIAEDKIPMDEWRERVKQRKAVEQSKPVSAPGVSGGIAGVMTGYYGGKGLSKATAGALSRHGYKIRNEEIANRIGTITAPLSALLGVGLGIKYRKNLIELIEKLIGKGHGIDDMLEGAALWGTGTLGGLAGGAATGGLTSLRGAFSKSKKDLEKTAINWGKASRIASNIITPKTQASNLTAQMSKSRMGWKNPWKNVIEKKAVSSDWILGPAQKCLDIHAKDKTLLPFKKVMQALRVSFKGNNKKIKEIKELTARARELQQKALAREVV